MPVRKDSIFSLLSLLSSLFSLFSLLSSLSTLSSLSSLSSVISTSTDFPQGLAYLHDLMPPILHLNVTPNHILFNRNGNIKICDFGSSVTLERPLNIRKRGTWAYMVCACECRKIFLL